jgi:hypothetical protein
MGMKSFARLTTLLMVASATIWAQSLFRRGGPFDLHITDVLSIAPEKHVGFSKSLEVYSVTAYGPEMSYILYCTKAAPETGKVYTALDEYVVSDLSFLHLWPVERSTLDLPPNASKKGRLYRVIIIQDVSPGNKPDLACDIYSEKRRQPNS